MLIIGVLFIISGGCGYLWASKYQIDWEQALEWAVDGTKPKGYDIAVFFNDYGILLVVLGLCLVGIDLALDARKPEIQQKEYKPGRFSKAISRVLTNMISYEDRPDPGEASKDRLVWVYCRFCGDWTDGRKKICDTCRNPLYYVKQKTK